jgi:uncharacterized protein
MTGLQLLRPVHTNDRYLSIDVVRGIALLGILLMNIVAMGLPFSYHNPAPMSGWNLRVWEMNELFVEGTMRGLFTMLFGAGMVLLTFRAEEKGVGVEVADIYYRRLLWLLLLSLIHAYLLLFHGEVLFFYALLGLLLFPLRKTRPLYLLLAGLLMLLIASLFSIRQYQTLHALQEKAAIAQSLEQKGKPLTKEQAASLEAWKGEQERARSTPEQIQRETQQMRGNYAIVFENNAQKVKFMHTLMFHDVFFWDFLSFMLIGMAFFKWGVFQARLSGRFYGLMMLIGYGIGLTVNVYEIHLIEKGAFSVLAYGQAEQSYHVGRIFTTLGHIGLIMLFIKSGSFSFLQRALAAVGRMALTNYISHSIFAMLIFTGVGLGLFGQIERYQLYFVVISIWLFQLVISPIWLHYFYYGPFEWLWRSLTYNKIQPFKRSNNTHETVLENERLPKNEITTDV